jgi:hypothetical protein
MTKLGTALLVASVISTSWACGNKRVATTFKTLETRVPPGTTVYVTGSDGAETKGRLEGLSGTSLKLRAPNAAVRNYAEGDVARITIQDPLWNGLAIGAAIGALGGIMSDESCTAPDADPGCHKVSRGAGIAGMAAIGGGVGLGIDLLHHKVVFRGSATRRAALTILPVVGRGRTGVMLSSRF